MRKKKYLFPILIGIFSIVGFIIVWKFFYKGENKDNSEGIAKVSEPSMHIFWEAYVWSGSCSPNVKRGVYPFSWKIIFMKKQDVTDLVKKLDMLRLSNTVKEAYEEQLDVWMRKVKYSSLFTFSKDGKYTTDLPYGEYIVIPDIPPYINQEITLEAGKKEKVQDFKFFVCK